MEDTDRLSKRLLRCARDDDLGIAKRLMHNRSPEERTAIACKRVGRVRTALCDAARFSSVKFVEFLLDECGADIEQRAIFTNGSLLVRRSISRMLADDKSVVSEVANAFEVAPLWYAALVGRLDVVKTLVRHGADVNALCGCGHYRSTPVFEACSRSELDVVQRLIGSGADIQRLCGFDRTCLMISKKNASVCDLLIRRGAALDAATEVGGHTALHVAAEADCRDTVRLLLERGGDATPARPFRSRRLPAGRGQTASRDAAAAHR